MEFTNTPPLAWIWTVWPEEAGLWSARGGASLAPPGALPAPTPPSPLPGPHRVPSVQAQRHRFEAVLVVRQAALPQLGQDGERTVRTYLTGQDTPCAEWSAPHRAGSPVPGRPLRGWGPRTRSPRDHLSPGPTSVSFFWEWNPGGFTALTAIRGPSPGQRGGRGPLEARQAGLTLVRT